jgi:hypothetical protein
MRIRLGVFSDFFDSSSANAGTSSFWWFKPYVSVRIGGFSTLGAAGVAGVLLFR